MDEFISKTKINKRHSISHLLMNERLTESGSPKIILASILTLSSVIIILIIWASLTQINEVTTGIGEIVPLEKITPIQHLEGGIVYETYVRDGDLVRKGQKLFELNPEPSTSDLKRLQKRQNSLEIDILRIQSMLEGRPVNENDLLSAITFKDVTEPALLKLQLANAQRYQEQEIAQREYNREQLADRLAQEKNNLKNIEDQIYYLEQRKKVIEDQFRMFDTLTQQQAVSRVDLLNIKERLQEISGNLLTVIKERTAVETTILDLENKLKTLEFDKENAALKQLNENTAQLLEVQEQISRAQVTVDRLVVKAEVDGVVKGFGLHPGDVITSGTELFQVVPVSAELRAEIKIKTKDVGHIEVGDPVQVKVDTYDFASYGSIAGTLESISASTFLDAQKIPFYKCYVALDRNYLGDTPGKNLIFPGMTVTADIKTSEKSLLQYMLKPVTRTFSDAFRER